MQRVVHRESPYRQVVKKASELGRPRTRAPLVVLLNRIEVISHQTGELEDPLSGCDVFSKLVLGDSQEVLDIER